MIFHSEAEPLRSTIAAISTTTAEVESCAELRREIEVEMLSIEIEIAARLGVSLTTIREALADPTGLAALVASHTARGGS